MSATVYTETEVREIAATFVTAEVAAREIELATALNSLLELAGDDLTRLRVGIEMLARTLLAPTTQEDKDQ